MFCIIIYCRIRRETDAHAILHKLAWVIPLQTGLQDKEAQLSSELSTARAGVDAALLDSINLAGAMDALFELVRCANRYMDEREASAAADPGRLTVQSCDHCKRRRNLSPMGAIGAFSYALIMSSVVSGER